MQRNPSTPQRPPRPAMESRPILFRPTWAEAYASRSRSSFYQKTSEPATPDPTGAADVGPAATVDFSPAALRATAKTAGSGPRPDTDAVSISSLDEAISSTNAARIIILGRTAEALRTQANLCQRSTKHLLN